MSEENVQESGVIEVSAKKSGFDTEVTVTYDFGKDLAEMSEKFGADVVHTNARANMKITLQGVIRRMIEAGKTATEIATACAEWKPGVQMERTVDPLAVARKAMAQMDDDAKQAFIEKLLAGG
jgi:hypothetical protein